MITAVILTKNEEKNIVDCLDSLEFAREIVIIDDYSKDRTLDVIQKLEDPRIKIFKRHLDSDFSSQRNFGLSKATGEWVLFLDADERVSKHLATEISRLDFKARDVNGYKIKREDVMWGHTFRFGETGNMHLLRLARRDAGVWCGRVHEEWNVSGTVKDLSSSIFHYPHQTVYEFLQEINYYTTIRAEMLQRKNTRVTLLNVVFYPLAKFILNYGVRRGFRDGIPGFIHALLMSFHSFLVRAKLWLLWKNSLKK